MRVLSGRQQLFYGWWLLAFGVLAMAVAAGVTVWSNSLYLEPLEDDFGWSRFEVSLGFSLSFGASGLAAPLIGRWIDRKGPRSGMVLGGVVTAAAYILLSTTSALWQWYLYLTIGAVFRQMIFFIPFQALLSRWFVRRRGTVVGILSAGFGLGGFALVPVMQAVIESVGWESSFILVGVVILVMFVPAGLWLIRNTPGEMGLAPDGEALPPDEAQSQAAAALVGMSPRDVLRQPLFWLYTVALSTLFFPAIGWISHAVPFLESLGVASGLAALLVGLRAGSGMFSRIIFGVVSDRVERIERLAMTVIVFLVGAWAVILLDTSAAGIAIFMVLYVLGSAGGPLMEPLLLTRAFGVAHFATLMGLMTAVTTSTQILSPAIAGWIFDSTGSYDMAVVLWLTMSGISLAAFTIAARMPRPTLPAAIVPPSESARIAPPPEPGKPRGD